LRDCSTCARAVSQAVRRIWFEKTFGLAPPGE
jgi:hypothetical protein